MWLSAKPAKLVSLPAALHANAKMMPAGIATMRLSMTRAVIRTPSPPGCGPPPGGG